MSFTSKGANVAQRFPRVLFFTVGMVPTEAEADAAAKFYPNVAMRNASAVGALPMSPLEECDAVAGAVPARYGDVYPNVSDFSASGGMLRMSDLDRPHGAVTDPNNEAARAAKPPSFGEVMGANQGAARPAGAITVRDGGFVAPQPVGIANVSGGSERTENAGIGANPSNPHKLPDAGVTALTKGVADADRVGLTTEAAPGKFAAPDVGTSEAEQDKEDAKKPVKPNDGKTGK